jgi:cobalt/nickel transport system permease protein
LRHARIERWSLGESAIHRRHAAAKFLATIVLLISTSTLGRNGGVACALYMALLVGAILLAKLPLWAILRSAMIVLPFAFCFALASSLAGDPEGALWLLIRAYLSSLAALLLIATTPMSRLLAGLEWMHVPGFLLEVMQFLYRYLIVLIEEAGAMRQAALARAGTVRALQFRQAAAAVSVLFARAYARAQAIHRAMLSRGFEGKLPVFTREPFRIADSIFVALTAVIVIAIRAVR